MASPCTIKTVKTWSENLELTRPYTIAYKTVNAVENVFVYLETHGGITGMGAGSPAAYVTGETNDACLNALTTHAQQLLIGKDIRDLTGISRALLSTLPDTPAARTAMDIALHDAFARHLGLPLVDILGRAHRSLPTSITIGIKDTVSETLAEADEYLGCGFKILKLKIGIELEQDIETVKKLREKVRDRMKIRVDANQGYTAEDLTRFSNATADCYLELIEQPVPKEQPALMLDVSEDIRAVCAGDESVQVPEDALAFAAHPQPFGIYNIKLMKCGGIYTARQIADIAQLGGIELMWGCMDESILSISAALHVALASPATRYLDLDGNLDLARDLVKGGFLLKDGMLSTISDAPGLGVERI